MPRRGLFEREIVRAVAGIASGILRPESYEPAYLAAHVAEAVRRVGLQLRSAGETIYCVLCRRGPFTRKGYYLHLSRVHYHEILRLVWDESERVAREGTL